MSSRPTTPEASPIVAAEEVCTNRATPARAAARTTMGGPSTFARIAKTQKLIADSDRAIVLGVDGGVTRANIAEIAKAGVDLIVTGSAVFDSKAAEEDARFMLAAIKT